MKIYKAHILFTKEKDHFDIVENGCIAVADGRVVGVATDVAARAPRQRSSISATASSSPP